MVEFILILDSNFSPTDLNNIELINKCSTQFLNSLALLLLK